MDFEFLKQYFLWELVFFVVGVALLLIGYGIYKLVKKGKPKVSKNDEEFLRRIEKVLDIEKRDDGIYVYGDVVVQNPKEKLK